jgi:LmbE family N-acetylglucosaminyl deacetylase
LRTGQMTRKAQDLTVRIICIGAHPDDCEIEFGGAAAKVCRLGSCGQIRLGDQRRGGASRASGRGAGGDSQNEAQEAARRLGIAETEDFAISGWRTASHDGGSEEIVRQIRQWKPMSFTHRVWDYHPDHRYTGQLVQDSAYLVMVPRLCPDTPALRHNPLFLLFGRRVSVAGAV